jgi:hypothetical protein
MHSNDGPDFANLPENLVLPRGADVGGGLTRYVLDAPNHELLRQLSLQEYALLPEDWQQDVMAPVTVVSPWEDRVENDERTNLWRRCLEGWRSFEAGQYEDACTRFEAVQRAAWRRHGSSWVSAARGLVRCLFRLGRHDGIREAVAGLSLWAGEHQGTEEWHDIWFIAGCCERDLGCPQQAIPFFDRVLEYNSEHPMAKALREACIAQAALSPAAD